MPGLDYERLVFWEDLADGDGSNLLGEFLRRNDDRQFFAPEWLDRQRLKAALIALDPEDLPIGLVIDDIVEGVAARIYWCWIEYRRQKDCAGPSKPLLRLHKALSEWIDKYSDGYEGHMVLSLLHSSDKREDNREDKKEDKRDAIVRLVRSTGMVINGLEAKRPRRKQEAPKTTFLRKLYELYVDLSRKPGLSNDGYGPGVCFVTECAALVHVAVPPGLRQLIVPSIARAKMDPK